MLLHARAVVDKLAPLTVAPYRYTVGVMWARKVEPGTQVIVVQPQTTGEPLEESAAMAGRDFAVDVRIKAIAGAPDGVLPMLDRVRDILAPERRWSSLVVPGALVQIRWLRSELATADTEVTFVDGSHPGVGVDTYRLTSSPL